jgi:hypothetical protein
LGVIGCNNSEFSENGTSIEESNEMEEYIIAGLEFYDAAKSFENSIAKVDMSSFETKLDSHGNMLIIIPFAEDLEKATKSINEKKQALIKKFPKIKKMKCSERLNHLNNCIQNSIPVGLTISRLKINDTPITRTEDTYSSEQDAFVYLEQCLASSDYVEVILVVFDDGTVMTHVDGTHTAHKSNIPLNKNGSEWYTSLYNSSPIDFLAHTHKSSEPSSTDIEVAESHPGLELYIYTSGGHLTKFSD